MSGNEVGRAGPKVLFFLSSVEYFVLFESLLRTMLDAGHRVLVALDHEKGGLPADKVAPLDALRERGPGFDYQELQPRTDLWRIPASAIRRSLDYLRYLQPGYADDVPGRADARDLAPRLLRGLLFVPPFRWGFGRRLIGWMLGRIEAGLPIPRSVRSFVSEQAPDVVLVSPLAEIGSAQGDYLRTAERARIPSVLVVASEEDLTSKGGIRDAPTLTLAWSETQVDEAVRRQGLSREAIVAVEAQSFNGHQAPAAPAAVEVVERAVPIHVVPRREGRILRPLLWLLTPLLAIVLPFLRPLATARVVVKAVRRWTGRIRKWARTRGRAMGHRRAQRQKARAQAAKEKKVAQAEAARETKRARAEVKAQDRARVEVAKQEKLARTEAAKREKQERTLADGAKQSEEGRG